MGIKENKWLKVKMKRQIEASLRILTLRLRDLDVT